METSEENKKTITTEENTTVDEGKKKQQQTDPQMTELKGFFDKKEKLEPTLEDEKGKEDDTKSK